MFEISQSDTIREAVHAIDRGDTLHGLITLECAPALRTIPVVNSYLAYCIAKERGQVRNAVNLCQSALSAEPDNPAHYLNLGRIFLLAEDKAKAIATFWKGVSKGPGAERGAGTTEPPRLGRREHALILEELRRLGIRKPAPFPSLDRRHPLNVIAGKFLATIGLR
jgi:hypothetical protein